MFESEFERNLFALRQEKLKAIEDLGQAAYPNRFPVAPASVAATIPAVRADWGEVAAEALNDLPEADRPHVTIAGRIMAIRAQGKAGFATLQQNADSASRSTCVRMPSAKIRLRSSTSCSTWATTSASPATSSAPGLAS